MNPLLTTGLATAADQRRGRTSLSVNLNKVALLRNTRAIGIPSVTAAAQIALEAGAHGITVHPRPDERHIRRADVFELAELLHAQWPQADFNIEGNPQHNLMALLRELAARGRAPQQCTFVPDSVEQATSDHGWRLPQDDAVLAPLVAEARSLGIRVSLFMDADLDSAGAMAAARALGADRVELYTESYARAFGTAEQDAVLARFSLTANAALATGLEVNAGHDLNRDNLTVFLATVPGVQEVSIGHALIADALEFGLGETVRDYLRCISLELDDLALDDLALDDLRLDDRAPAGEAQPVIYGIGTDICDVRRIARSLQRRGDRFAERVLGAQEIEVFRARRQRVDARGIGYLATRFSAKEAFSKAIGLGLHWPMTWRACEVLNAPGGKPEIRLNGELAAWFAAKRLRAHVSISDETDYATSFVVVETTEGDAGAR